MKQFVYYSDPEIYDIASSISKLSLHRISKTKNKSKNLNKSNSIIKINTIQKNRNIPTHSKNFNLNSNLDIKSILDAMNQMRISVTCAKLISQVKIIPIPPEISARTSLFPLQSPLIFMCISLPKKLSCSHQLYSENSRFEEIDEANTKN